MRPALRSLVYKQPALRKQGQHYTEANKHKVTQK